MQAFLNIKTLRHLDIMFIFHFTIFKSRLRIYLNKICFSLQSKNYSARYKFTGKGTFKITNINSEDAGQWLCYDEKNDYTSKNYH